MYLVPNSMRAETIWICSIVQQQTGSGGQGIQIQTLNWLQPHKCTRRITG